MPTTKPIEQVLNSLSAVLTIQAPLSVSQWAERYFYIPEEGNAEPGKFHCDRMPWQTDMLDDPLNTKCEAIYWMIGSQLGKTLCICIVIGYFIDHSPTAILVVYPTLDSAKAWMREKFIPSTRATPQLVGRLKEPRARDSESTTLNRKFPGGNLTAVGANSPATLRQRSKRVVIQDELDTYEVTPEGDPEALADKRSETFSDAVKLKSSTTTKKGLSRIEKGFERSDRQYFFVPCQKCGAMQHLKWRQFRFSFKQEDGTERRDTENAVYVCEVCNAEWSDQERIAAINDKRAEWRATAPFKRVRGRHLNGLYQIIGLKGAFKTYHHQFAENFLEAKSKGKSTLQVWTNTFLCESWEEETEQVEWAPLMKRVEDYGGDMPEEVCLLTAACDIQSDRVEIEVVGWGDEEETWGIEKRIVWGDFDLPEVQQQVDDFLLASWTHPSGIALRITATGIDSAHKTKAVYRFCRKRAARRVFALKGSPVPHSPLVTPRRHKHYNIWTYSVGTDTAKDSIYSRLRIDETEGPRVMHFPIARGYTESYFKQLCSEKLQTFIEKGVVRRKWIKVFERNESLDLRVYNLATYDILKPNIPRVRQSVIPKTRTEQTTAAKPAPQLPPPEQPANEQHKPKRRRLIMRIGERF